MDAAPGLNARPLVSCVVPAFNAAEHLAEALASIHAQSHRPIEAIVVDDGSTDGTVAIARAHAPFARLVRQSTAGPAATRNRGIREARGEFVAFLDPDDLWEPTKLARQLRRFAQRPELQCSLTYARAFWDEGSPVEADHYRDHRRLRPVPGYATTTLLARRDVFDEVGGLDESLWYADAADWLLRATEAGVVLEVLPDVLTLHRLHGANLTRRRADASAGEFLDLVKRRLDRIRASGAT